MDVDSDSDDENSREIQVLKDKLEGAEKHAGTQQNIINQQGKDIDQQKE